MKFFIEVEYYRKRYKINVELIKSGLSLEYFKLSAGNKKVILQSNKPLLIAKGLKHKKTDWKIKEGTVLNPDALRVVISAIEKKITLDSDTSGIYIHTKNSS